MVSSRIMAACDVAVVGGYPPAPGPATAATLAAVRRAWSTGATVRVVSYRPGAADLVVPVVGPLAGRRLDQVRRHYQCPERVVLVLQYGAPFSDRAPAAQMATAAGLVLALRHFAHAEVVVGEDPEVLPPVLWALALVASRFSAASPELAEQLRKRYRLISKRVEVDTVDAYPLVANGTSPSSWGVFDPSVLRSLTVVETSPISLTQRLRERAGSSRVTAVRRLRGR